MSPFMRLRRNKQGQSIVEFALVLPILLLFILGIAEFGLLFNSFLNITFASKEGARIASLDTDTSTAVITQAINATVPSTTPVTVTVTPAAPRVSGLLVTVTVSTNHTFITPIISALVPSNPYTISATTTMRSE